MDAAAFETFYLHANSIAELAFRRAISRVLLAPPPVLTPGQLAANEALAHRMANPSAEDFNWAALEGVAGYGGESPEGAQAAEEAIPDVEPPDPALADEPMFADVSLDPDEDPNSDAPPDIGLYLARVDAARGLLQRRVADCFRRADQPALAAALATLPADRPPITGALSTEDFIGWLELYEASHEGLVSAVMEIRKLEPLF